MELYRDSWLPGGGYLIGKEVYLITLMGFLLILYISDINNIFNFTPIRYLRVNKYQFLLIFLLMVSTFMYNIQEITNRNYLMRFFSFGVFIFIYFLLIPNFFYLNPGYFDKFLRLITYLGLLSAIFGFIVLVLGINPKKEFSDQLTSYIVHPNNSSIIFTISCITTIYYYHRKKSVHSFRENIFYLTSFFIQIIAQLYTYTRAGYLGTSIGLLIYFSFYYRKKFLFILPMVIISIPFFLRGFVSSKGFESFLSRFLLLIPAYFTITKNEQTLLWGNGTSDALKQFQNNLMYNLPQEGVLDPHNSYVTLIMMFGILFSFVLFVLIIKQIFKGIKRILSSEDTKERLIFIYITSFIISLCIQGLFDAELVKPEFYSMQFLLIIFGILRYSTMKHDNSHDFLKAYL